MYGVPSVSRRTAIECMPSLATTFSYFKQLRHPCAGQKHGMLCSSRSEWRYVDLNLKMKFNPNCAWVGYVCVWSVCVVWLVCGLCMVGVCGVCVWWLCVVVVCGGCVWWLWWVGVVAGAVGGCCGGWMFCFFVSKKVNFEFERVGPGMCPDNMETWTMKDKKNFGRSMAESALDRKSFFLNLTVLQTRPQTQPRYTFPPCPRHNCRVVNEKQTQKIDYDFTATLP